MMIYSATITSQGQVTIPAPIRKALDLSEKEKINFILKGKQAIIEPEPDILALEGVFKTKKRIPFSKIRKAFGTYMAQRSVGIK